MRFEYQWKYFLSQNAFEKFGCEMVTIFFELWCANMICSQIAKLMGPTWGPPGSYRPQMDPMLAPWTLLSGLCLFSMVRYIVYFIEAMWCKYASVNNAIIGSDNGLLPIRCQAIIWTNAGFLLIRPQGKYFKEILFEIEKFSFKEMHWKFHLQNGGHLVST